MMKTRKIDLATGLNMIREVRPIIQPNPGFMVQLKALERNLFGKLSKCEVLQGQWKEKYEEKKKEIERR